MERRHGLGLGPEIVESLGKPAGCTQKMAKLVILRNQLWYKWLWVRQCSMRLKRTAKGATP